MVKESDSDIAIGLLQKLKEIVTPSARGIVQGLIDATANVQKAAEANDLAAATRIVRRGAELVKQLLPKLTDPKIHRAYEKILKANIKLNKNLKANKADLNDIAQFLKYIIKKLGAALSDKTTN